MPAASVRYLQIHYFLVFMAFPLAMAFLKPRGWIYIVLWFAAFFAFCVLKRDHGYSFRADWNRRALNRKNIREIVLRFLPLALALLAFAWVMIPERLFNLPLERPRTWVMVMLLYPLLSVVPQEVLFRTFFFRFYRPWLNDRWLAIASALAFGWIHVVLLNWVAVVFSAIGGWLFADTYRKTNSLAAACLEHALYGCFIFTIGMGFYFYHGQAVR